jgi:hypothetical protein
MPGDFFRPGNACFVTAKICNAEGNSLTLCPVFIILDLHGNYYFAPGFSQALDYYLDEIPSIAEGTTRLPVIEEFIWPAKCGYESGVQWISAVTDPNLTNIIGDLSTRSFGWSE